MDIQKIPVKKIKHAKYNPRKNLKPGDNEYEKLKRSIKEFGYVEPVIWNQRTGNIVGGHQRFKVLTQLGEKEVDCVVVDMDDEKEKALNVALNKVSGDWDMPLLTDLLKDLDDSGFDLSLTGFDLAEINELFGEPDAQEDDFDPDQALDEITTPMTQTGDVWLLGKHRLICGDSTLKDDMDTLIDGQLADLILTDPPYNVDYQGGTKEKLKIQNDKLGDAAFLEFLTAAFERMFEQSKKGAPIYVFHADSEGYNFRTAFKEAGYVLRQCLVWVKNSLVMGRQDYQWQHEPVIYGWKDGAGHAWYGDRKQTTLVRFDKPLRNGEHPTMKPVGLCGYFIGNSSKEGDIVLDSFGGSGSTLIACEQMGRVCYTSELDSKYCDVIVKRYAEAIGCEDGISVIRNGKTIPYSELLPVE